jgi:hypothetical protein
MKLIAGKLEKVTAERDKADAAVTELRSKLDALDVEADDYATVRQSIDAQLAVRVRALGILNDQVAKLEAKAAAEARVASEARRAAAIKAVEAMLPERVKIVEQIEAAVKSIPGLFDKLDAWRAKFIKNYPRDDVEFPYAHFIETDRIHRTVLAAFRTIRPDDVHEAVDGMARHEARQHEALVDSLRPTTESEKAA